MKTRHRKKTNKKIKFNRRSRRGGAPVDIDAKIANLSDGVKATVTSKVDKLNITNEIDEQIVLKALLICKIKSLNIKECESKILNKENLKKLKQLSEKIKKTYKKDIPDGFKIFEKFISDLSPSQWISDVTTPSTESITDSITEFIDTTEVGKARELREDNTRHANNWCLFVRTAIIILLEKIKFKLKPQLEHTTIEPVVKKSMRRRFGESIGSVASAISSAGTSAKRFVRLGEDNKNEAVYFYNKFSIRLAYYPLKNNIVLIDRTVNMYMYSKYILELINKNIKFDISLDDVTELDTLTETESNEYETQKGINVSIIESYKLFVTGKFYNTFEVEAKRNETIKKMLNVLKYIIYMIDDSIKTINIDEKRVQKEKKEEKNGINTEMGQQNPAIKHLKQAKDTYIKTSERFVGLIKTLSYIVGITKQKEPSQIEEKINTFKRNMIERARDSAEVTKAALENSANSVKEIGRIRDAMQRSMALSKINIKKVTKYENLAVVINELVKIYAEFIKTKLTTSQEEIKDSIRLANMCLDKINKIEKNIDMDSRETLLYYKGEAETVIKNMQSDIGERANKQRNNNQGNNVRTAKNRSLTAKNRLLINKTAKNNATELHSASNAIDEAQAEVNKFTAELKKAKNGTLENKILSAKKEYAESKYVTETYRRVIIQKTIELRKKQREKETSNNTSLNSDIATLETEKNKANKDYETAYQTQAEKKAALDAISSRANDLKLKNTQNIQALVEESIVTTETISKVRDMLKAHTGALDLLKSKLSTGEPMLNGTKVTQPRVDKMQASVTKLQMKYNTLLEHAPPELRAKYAASNISNQTGLTTATGLASGLAQTGYETLSEGATALGKGASALGQGLSSFSPFGSSQPATSVGP